MNQLLTPIPTVYRGIRFRSRLEARWALFLDEIGLSYHYELEGFESSNTRYLPDFFIPAWNTWIEIKPKEPTSEEWKKCEELLISLLKTEGTASVAILYGRPWLDERGPEYRYLTLVPMLGFHPESDDSEEGIDITAENLTPEYIDSDERIFTECRRCQRISLDSLGMHFPDVALRGHCGLHGCCDRASATVPDSYRLMNAYKVATERDFSTT